MSTMCLCGPSEKAEIWIIFPLLHISYGYLKGIVHFLILRPTRQLVTSNF